MPLRRMHKRSAISLLANVRMPSADCRPGNVEHRDASGGRPLPARKERKVGLPYSFPVPWLPAPSARRAETDEEKEMRVVSRVA